MIEYLWGEPLEEASALSGGELEAHGEQELILGFALARFFS